MADDHGHSHGHSHGHGHGLNGSWGVWLDHRVLRIVLIAMAGLAGLTLAGVISLWPDGSGRERSIAKASTLGLVNDRFDATVDNVMEGPCSFSAADDPQVCRSVDFLLHQGPDAGTLWAGPEQNLTVGAPALDLKVGDKVVIAYEEATDFYFFSDRDRGNSLIWLTLLFAAVVIALGRLRGVMALISMACTVAVLVGFVAPSVLDGNDPLLVAVVAGSLISFVGLYLTHGFSPTTTVALAGTLASLLLTLAVSWVFFSLAQFSGLATEEGLTLPLVTDDVNLSSLLLGGAVLGALGALDDITVTQVATVAELRHRNTSLTAAELVASGVRVGREHIASTINTLLLAYAGASMPLLLLLAAEDQPLTVTANSESVAVEIMRTLCGSIGLVAAVPITTILAAVLVGAAGTESSDDDGDEAPDRVDGDDGPSRKAAAADAESDGDPPVPTDEPASTSPVEADQDLEEPPGGWSRIGPDRKPSWDDFAPDDIDEL